MADAYADYAVTKGASEAFPLVDIASGTTILAYVNSARNGALTGWDLQNTAGPVSGTLAPYSDGTNDYGNVLTSGGGVGLADIFNGNLGSVFMWGKSGWNGISSYLLVLHVNNNNRLIALHNASNVLQFRHTGGGTSKTETHDPGAPSGWFSWGASWDTSGAGEMKTYYNGAQIGGTQTGLGVFSGTLTLALIGALSTTPTNVWDGHLAYYFFRFGAKWSAADFADLHNAALPAGQGALLASERNRLVR